MQSPIPSQRFLSTQKHVTTMVGSRVVRFFGQFVPWMIGVPLGVYSMVVFYDVWFLSIHHPHYDQVVLLGISIFFALMTQWVMKYSFRQPRPFLCNVPSLYRYGGYDSFPSGHSLVYMTIGVSLSFIYVWVGVFGIISALFIGGARVIAGIHWPRDSMWGFVLGASIALLVQLVAFLLIS